MCENARELKETANLYGFEGFDGKLAEIQKGGLVIPNYTIYNREKIKKEKYCEDKESGSLMVGRDQNPMKRLRDDNAIHDPNN